MDGIVICTREGLLYGRHYLWYAPDLLVIEARLTDDEQRQAIDDAFAFARARCLVATRDWRDQHVA